METEYSREEEYANAATHGLGLLGAIAGAVMLLMAVHRYGDTWGVVSCWIYAVTLVAVYAVSTLSHALRNETARHRLRIADQAVIYLFIAGSFTPIGFTWLRDGYWWTVPVGMWIVAIIGFARKALFSHKVHLGSVSTVLYLVLGWMPVLGIWHLVQTAPAGLSVWLIGGGLCYTSGILFFHYDQRIRYFHAGWHLMVIAGSVCHFLGILFYCTQG